MQGASEASGYAEVQFVTQGLPPSGGRFVTSNLTGFGFETIFALELIGWGGEDFPLSYGFGYKHDFMDPYSEVRWITMTFSDQRQVKTYFPPGVVMPSNRLQAIGYVKSSLGAITQTTLEMSVKVPFLGTSRDRTFKMAQNMDPETSLIYGNMLALTAELNDYEELALILELIENKTGLRNWTVWDNRQKMPLTPEVAVSIAALFTTISEKGLKTWRVLEDLTMLLDICNNSDMLIAERSFSNYGTNVILSLVSAIDTFMPGDVDLDGPMKRRLEARARRQKGRYLQAAVPVGNRTVEDTYDQFEYVRNLERDIGDELMGSIFPGEMPVNLSTRGHDFYLGKVPLDDSSKLQTTQSDIQDSFSVPTIFGFEQPPIENYIYRYTQFKKFVFNYVPFPPRHSLDIPAPPSGTSENKIPDQEYTWDESNWHAMSLELIDEAGSSLDETLSETLQTVPFNLLPRISAHHLLDTGTVKHAATCFTVNQGGGNVSAAFFDPKGITFNEEACVVSHLSDFVVLVDDLGQDLGVIEEIGDDLQGMYIDEYRSMAGMSSLVFVFVVAFTAAGCGLYVDETLEDEKPAIDDDKIRVVEGFDEKETLVQTTKYTFRRNHLIVGFIAKHRKLNRQRRVWCLLLAWVATQALATLFHSKLEFRAEAEFVATGLIAGILVFPLVQFAMYLYEWSPETKVLPVGPPGSKPAKPIPMKEKAARAGKLFEPLRPPVPAKVPPPPPRAPLRVYGGSFVPSLPLAPPAPPLRPGQKPKFPPPRRPPFHAGVPKPPPGPPPKHYLTASRGPENPPELLSLPDLPARPEGGLPGPYGLVIPELGKLALRDADKVMGKAPNPPPRPPNHAPRPPREPPPLTKMYFTANTGSGPPRVPPIPPVKVGLSAGLTKAKLPALPPLPKLSRPPNLSMVKLGDASAAPAPPPPPPPPKRMGTKDSDGIVGPESPHSSEMALPGALSATGESLLDIPGRSSRSQRSGGPEPPTPPPQDVEASAAFRPAFSEDPEHSMPPPRHDGRQPPPPPPMQPQGRRIPTPPGSQAASSSGPLFTAAAKPPPFAPPPGTSGPGGIGMPPLRLGQNGAPPERMPALPKLPLPALAPRQVSSIPASAPGVVPPPPPPPLQDVVRPGVRPPPPPARHEARPMMARKALPYTAGGKGGVIPKPPSLKPQVSLRPKPPTGPPPAHAIILKARPWAPTNAGVQAAAKRTSMAPPAIPKPPPEASLPSFFHRSKLPADQVGGEETVAKKEETALLLANAWKKYSEGSRPRPSALRRLLWKKPPEHYPVPDWIVKASVIAVQCFMSLTILMCCLTIVWFGTNFTPAVTWATHGSTIIGCVINTTLFESLKCFVLASLALVKAETIKKQQEANARFARLELKAQRADRPDPWGRKAQKVLKSAKIAPPPPPLMG
eukprot:TRINITY_DN29335_c0_g3_i1.p1 TRINITY_DN29335_c0_g3~~TRINITY_DN29335_c0_g3_i1.p1  ORF type:complete len:1424 (+),score=297.99 TRINITY_DN29335_c0_g3_i1:49-4272(+)